jgi:EAL domain-containing protein (putative c-di-GMP-specific phosphodiesterase class I)
MDLYTNAKSKNFFDMLVESNLVQHAYQPIIHLITNRLIGYEALLRCGVRPPVELLYRAQQIGRLFELDSASIHKSLANYFKNNNEKVLFLNILPNTILHPCFLSFVDEYLNHIPREKIIFEINENSSIENMDSFKYILSYLRGQGFRIALDDVGAGTSSIPKMIELEPEVIKLDRYLAKDLALSKTKQRVVEMLVNYCRKDILMILEGIENSCDLEMAKQLGVQIGQGFLLGKPTMHTRGST